jgi:hypothetical protein
LQGFLFSLCSITMADPAELIANSVNQTNAATDEEYSDYPEFPLPEGFTPPEGTQTGTPFQALGTFRVKSDGSMCLLAVDGSPVTSGEAAPAPPEESPVAPAAPTP